MVGQLQDFWPGQEISMIMWTTIPAIRVMDISYVNDTSIIRQNPKSHCN